MYVSGAGEDVTINVMIDVSRDNYMAYTREFYGAHIIIHRRDDFVGQTMTRVVSVPGFETVSLITANVVYTHPDVRSMNLKQRGCYFDGEVSWM